MEGLGGEVGWEGVKSRDLGFLGEFFVWFVSVGSLVVRRSVRLSICLGIRLWVTSRCKWGVRKLNAEGSYRPRCSPVSLGRIREDD